AGAFGRMKRVPGRVDDRGTGAAAVVALEAELVSLQAGASAVRIVAVRAGHARGVHAASEEGGELVVLLEDLSIGMEEVLVVDDGEEEVIPERIARREIAGDLAAARVAGGAVLHVHRGSELGEGRVGPAALLAALPLHVLPHGPVAGLASDPELGHGGGVRVAFGLVVLLEARVVAGAAHGVPVHAAARPVAPFAGLPVFVAEDSEPLAGERIVGGLNGLE